MPDVMLSALAAIAAVVLVLVAVNLSIGVALVDQRVESLYGVDDPQFVQTVGAVLGPGLLAGNSVQPHYNGAEIFPAMLGAIRGARRSVTFETYIYWSGDIGRAFAETLAERASAGIACHVLLDWAGSWDIDEHYIVEMQRAGVQVERYRAPSWRNCTRLNNRTHRKLLVVDGRTGYTGGAGIADAWTGNAEDPAHWRDTHFRVDGPAVAQMQAIFAENWIEATGVVLHGSLYFPAQAACGPQAAQAFASSPGAGAEKVQLMYLLSIAAARRVIRLSESYFVPDRLTMRALLDALARGVRVQIVLPGEHIDFRVVRRASRACWGRLLEAGAEIYEYRPTMYHCKIFIVDDLWVSVGSTNFDQRSFRINDEANLNVHDGRLARELAARFEEDVQRSRRVAAALC